MLAPNTLFSIYFRICCTLCNQQDIARQGSKRCQALNSGCVIQLLIKTGKEKMKG